MRARDHDLGQRAAVVGAAVHVGGRVEGGAEPLDGAARLLEASMSPAEPRLELAGAVRDAVDAADGDAGAALERDGRRDDAGAVDADRDRGEAVAPAGRDA